MALLTSAQRTPVSRFDVRPTITVDLRLLGLEFPEHSPALRAYELMKNKVAFTDQNTLAVSFFVPNNNQGLSVRGRIFGGPYLFQTVFLDARTGKALRTQTWSNSGNGCGLFPSPDGGFIIWHDLDLSLHVPDGTVRTTLALNAEDFPRIPSVVQSPSGNTLFATTDRAVMFSAFVRMTFTNLGGRISTAIFTAADRIPILLIPATGIRLTQVPWIYFFST